MSFLATKELTLSQRHIWRVYLGITVVFAVVNGLCTSYAFLYLRHILNGMKGSPQSIFDNLLFILVGSMFFEFFAEPITGDWADAYGRRRALFGAFFGLAVVFLLYWSIASEAVLALSPASAFGLVIALSLLAELFFAVSSALFNGALDAWFVDELRISGGPERDGLLGFFSVQRRWFGVFMVVGGAGALWIGEDVVHGGNSPASTTTGGLTALPALPWLAAACISALASLWVKTRMVERRMPLAGDGPPHRRIWLRLVRALGLRDLRNALLVSSVLYSCWICFAYLLPVLLTEQTITSEAGIFRVALNDYYWFYLAMGTSRLLGPYLSNRLWMSAEQVIPFRAWGVLNCGALGVAGVALLFRSHAADGTGSGINGVIVHIALLLFWVTKVAEEAFKPIRSMYLNCLMDDGDDRAFVLSMATPFGAVTILIGVGLLAVSRHFFAALNDVGFSVPLLFAILGAIGVLFILNLSRRATLVDDLGAEAKDKL